MTKELDINILLAVEVFIEKFSFCKNDKTETD